MKRLLIILILLLYLGPMNIFAESNSSTDMLQVAPLKYDEILNLGDIKEGTIDIMNPSSQDESIVVETASFKTTSVTGQLEFYKNNGINSL